MMIKDRILVNISGAFALPLQGEWITSAGRVGIHRKEKLGRDLISREDVFSLKRYTESKFTLFTMQCIEEIINIK